MNQLRNVIRRSHSIRLIPLSAVTLSVAIGFAIILGALRLPISRTADVGSGRLPLLIGVAIIGLSVAFAIQQTLSPLVSGGPETVPNSVKAAILLGLLIAYCISIPIAGMLVSTGLFMMAVMLWLDGLSRWLRSTAVTVVFIALIHALFTWVIATPLP